MSELGDRQRSSSGNLLPRQDSSFGTGFPKPESAHTLEEQAQALKQAQGDFWWCKAGLDPRYPRSPNPSAQQCVRRLARLISHAPSLLSERGPVGETVLSWCVLSERGHTPLAARARAAADYLIEEHPELVVMQYSMYKDTSWFGTGARMGLYDGEVPLHIAVVQGNDARLTALLDAGGVERPELRFAQLRCRAYGTFFSPGPEGGCYYGEMPLSFAASIGCVATAELLLSGVVESQRLELLLAQDSFGHNALHMAVLHRQMDMLRWLLRQEETEVSAAPPLPSPQGQPGPASPDAPAAFGARVQSIADPGTPGISVTRPPGSAAEAPAGGGEAPEDEGALERTGWRRALQHAQASSVGLTPLSLAAVMRDTPLFAATLATLRRRMWSYGDIVCFALPLGQLETDALERATGFLSVMQLCVTEQLTELAAHPVIVELFTLKWNSFGRTVFLVYCAVHVARLLILTALSQAFMNDPVGVVSSASGRLECAALLFGMHGLLEAVWDEVLASRSSRRRARFIGARRAHIRRPEEMPVSLFKQARRGEDAVLPGVTRRGLLSSRLPTRLPDALLLGSHLLSVAHFIAWGVESVDAARVLLAMQLISAWIGSVEYLVGHQRLGVLAIVIDKVIRTDITVYAFFLVIAIVGFGEALFVLGAEDALDGSTGLAALTLQLFRVSEGERPTWARRPSGHFPILIYIIYIMFALFTWIVLMRLLICMFNATFVEVHTRAQQEWLLAWARFVVRYERRLQALRPSVVKASRRDSHNFRTYVPGGADADEEEGDDAATLALGNPTPRAGSQRAEGGHAQVAREASMNYQDQAPLTRNMSMAPLTRRMSMAVFDSSATQQAGSRALASQLGVPVAPAAGASPRHLSAASPRPTREVSMASSMSRSFRATSFRPGQPVLLAPSSAVLGGSCLKSKPSAEHHSAGISMVVPTTSHFPTSSTNGGTWEEAQAGEPNAARPSHAESDVASPLEATVRVGTLPCLSAHSASPDGPGLPIGLPEYQEADWARSDDTSKQTSPRSMPGTGSETGRGHSLPAPGSAAPHPPAGRSPPAVVCASPPPPRPRAGDNCWGVAGCGQADGAAGGVASGRCDGNPLVPPP